jgi:septal ring factor EnvC (AmiA/AmiB activator)
MERTGIWTRMGQWFRTPRPNGVHSVDDDGNPDAAPAGGETVRVSPLARLRGNRGANVARLEQEYARVVRLIESVQHHLEQHSDRAERMSTSLDRLAESLAHLPESSRGQLDLLAKIGEKVAADAASHRNLEQSLSELPRLADAQRETMVAIGRQLESSRESSERVAAVLGGFKEGLSQVAEATSATGRAMEKTRWDAAARDDRLATILQEQTRRLTMFAVAAMSLAAVAALASVIAMFF